MGAVLALLLIGQLSSFEITPVSTPQYAGDSFSITIIARDPSGGVYDYNRPAFLSTTRGAMFIYPNVIGPFRNGVWQGRVMVTIADSLAIRCTDDSARVTSNSNVFEVFPGAPARFLTILPGQRLSPGTQTGRLGQPDNQTAGDSFQFRVYLTDRWCNPVQFRTDSVYFAASDGFARLPAGGEISNGSGSFTASFRAAGPQRIFVLSASGQPFLPDTSATFIVNPGAFARLLLLLPGEVPLPGDTATAGWQTPGKINEPLPQYLREPFTVQVYPCDNCWNRVITTGLTVSLRSDYPAVFVPAETTLTDSVSFSVQFNFAGPNQNIWVSDPARTYESYRTILEIKARGTSLIITAPDTVVAGETAKIRVVVQDANGEPITATVCRFSVIKGNGEMLEEALLTDTLGMVTAHFLCTRARFAEFDTIKISSGVAESLIGIYVDIPDSTLMSGKIVAFPNPFGFNRDGAEIFYYLNFSCPISFRIYDQFGNEVISYQFRQGEPGARAGVNRVIWDGRNKEGRRVASGVYLVQVVGQVHTKVVYRSVYRLGVVW